MTRVLYPPTSLSSCLQGQLRHGALERASFCSVFVHQTLPHLGWVCVTCLQPCAASSYIRRWRRLPGCCFLCDICLGMACVVLGDLQQDPRRRRVHVLSRRAVYGYFVVRIPGGTLPLAVLSLKKGHGRIMTQHCSVRMHTVWVMGERSWR